VNSPPGAIPGPRGCGKTRVRGGVYAEVGTGPGGRPIEEFLFDPPILIPAGFNVPNRGVLLTERNGVWHVVDRVGNEFYPCPADFVEECLLPETLIATSAGLRQIQDIQPGDQVLTHLGRYRPVQSVMRRPYQGDLISIKTVYSPDPLRLTPEHPVLRARVVRGRARRAQEGLFGERIEHRGFVPAHDVQVGDYLCYPIQQHIVDRPFVTMAYTKVYAAVHGNSIRSDALQESAGQLRGLDLPIKERQHRLLQRLAGRRRWTYRDIRIVADNLYAYESGLARAQGDLVGYGLLERAGRAIYDVTDQGIAVSQQPYTTYAAIGRQLGVSEYTASRLINQPLVEKRHDIALKVPVDTALLTLIGYYLAEGSVVDTTQGGKEEYWNNTEFSFGKDDDELRYAQAVQRSAEALGWGAALTVKNGCYHVVVRSRHLAHFLVEHFGKGAHHKRIPTWVVALPSYKLTTILTTYLDGDGYRRGYQQAGTTVSVNLAYGIAQIANKIGYRASIARMQLTGLSHGHAYTVTLYNRVGNDTFTDGEYLYLKVTARMTIPIAGDVCNLVVEEDESYCTMSHTVHNCSRYGVSRRLPNNIDFSKLTADSRLLLVHDRAWIDNCADFAPWRCPKHIELHAFDQSPPMCAGVWWEDVRDVNALAPGIRHIHRTMPGFSYEARRAPDGVEGQYRQAFFASFPIHRLAVVQGSPKTATSVQAAQKSKLPVVEVTQ